MMLHKSLLLATAASALMLSAGVAFADPVTLTFESWRTDDASVWTDTIIPMFEKRTPTSKSCSRPPIRPTTTLRSMPSSRAARAGDIILCRPFDASLALFQAGNLPISARLPGMENFPDSTKVAWQTDDGKSTFCLPMASVIHGFIYNKDAFADAGITDTPKTVDDFFADLDKIKAKGNYTAIDMGTHDQWEAATMGYQNIGPNYWKGEDGRKALIAGQQKLTDADWVAPYEQLAKWAPYLGDGYQAQTYSDSQNLFSLGKAAIYPAGSWDIPTFEKANPDLKMGASRRRSPRLVTSATSPTSSTMPSASTRSPRISMPPRPS